MSTELECAAIDDLVMRATKDLHQKMWNWAKDWPEFPLWFANGRLEIRVVSDGLALTYFNGAVANVVNPASSLPADQRTQILDKMKERIP